jgi:branched-chain amino acid transport system ATP-binding protein
MRQDLPSERVESNPGELRVASLTCRFGGLVAVDNVSLRARRGLVLGLVGPNGAGKSTLIQLITGVIRPSSGTISFAGQTISGKTTEDIAALGVARTFQTSRVFPGLTVWESVLVGGHVDIVGGGRKGRRITVLEEFASAFAAVAGSARRRAELERRAEWTLQLFGDRLWPRRANLASSLSYANRRRLELARACVADPLLLLLDEPTAGMNPTETNELAKLIGELSAARPHLAVVLVEHKMDVIRELCSEVVVMNQGSVIAKGPPGDVLEDRSVVDAYLGAVHGAPVA